ncbi:hypothetical protein BDB01DRAFT_794401, partial [Pilobolus umbonatus]
MYSYFLLFILYTVVLRIILGHILSPLNPMHSHCKHLIAISAHMHLCPSQCFI